MLPTADPVPGPDMDEHDHQQFESDCQHQFLAQLLRSIAPDLSRAAARRFAQIDPTINTRYDQLTCRHWHELFSQWINDLAGALAVCRPEILHRQVAWSKSLFGSRNVTQADVINALSALRDATNREVPEDDRPLVADYITSAIAHLSECPGCAPCHLDADCPKGTLALQYVVTILEGDRRKASDLILGAVHRGMPIRDVYLSVLLPAMQELGRMWERNEIDVAEEHFCTATTEMVLSQLYSHLPRTQPNGKTVVLAAAEGNYHQIGVRMVSDFFEMAGWRSIYLGASVPGHDLALAVFDFNADVLAIAACMFNQVQAVGDAIATVRSCPEAMGVRIIVGGRGFDGTGDLWTAMGADALAMSPEDAVAQAQSLLSLNS